jgi:hypothetical protein
MLLRPAHKKSSDLIRTFALVVIWPASLALAKDAADPRIREVKTIFVAGNNEAAEKIRADLRNDAEKAKVCFRLVTKAADADAVLEVSDDSVKEPGLTTGRHDRVTGTLTTKSGDLIWSRTDSFSDAPFMSGVKTAAGLVYRRLKTAICK